VPKKRQKTSIYKYRWKAIDHHAKRISGAIFAYSQLEVEQQLSAKNLRIKKITKTRLSTYARIAHQINRKEIIVFTRQLATMLATNIPLLQALLLISNHHKKAEMKSTIFRMRKSIEAGLSMSEALTGFSAHFDKFYIDLVATGEQSGNLDQAFERLANYLEKRELVREKVQKALIYPSMVLIVALSVSFVMLTLVIPEFDAMFSSFGADLPWFTQKVVELSQWLRNDFFTISLCFTLTSLTVTYCYRNSNKFELTVSTLSIRMPIIGNVLAGATIAKLCRTLAISFKAGIPILEALASAARTSNQLHFKKALEQVYSQTASGLSIYQAMRNTHAFPELMLQMILIGEETGKLDEMLEKIALHYESAVDNTVDNLGKILEPLILIFLGTVVGGLVVSMYLPLFNMMSITG
jgi:type IV pilus assembly protein PilC